MDNFLEILQNRAQMAPSTPGFESFDQLFKKQKAKSLTLRLETIKERKQRLRAFGKLILSKRAEIGAAVHADLNKPLAEIDISEVYPVMGEIRNAVSNLDSWAHPEVVETPLTYFGSHSEIIYEPKGVCLIIAPWNFPFNLCLGPLISCLAAGNTAIVKPSEATPNTSSLIAHLIREFFEEDMVAVVEGGVDVTTDLLKIPFDHIFFTGSTHVGKIVMRAAAENLSSVTLELGGKSPTIIDRSANLQDAATRIAFGKFLNTGQTCIAPDYVLIEKSVEKEFIQLLVQKIKDLFGENGKIDEKDPNYSRIINQKNFKRIESLIQDALVKGAKAEFEGPAIEEKKYIHPIILSQVSLSARIMEEEIFGPVLPILTYETEQEAIDLINSKPKPLALYVFSTLKSFQNKILRETSSGSACINDCVLQFTHPNLPFGGVNASGIGKSHGRFGFLAFSNERPVVKQRSGLSSPYFLHPPYTPRVKKIIDMMVKWF